ncbi:MAG: restriction endonuclease subunit S [Methanobrevibacter sp.]|nr:restriction endonuclease subunit S [Methanobrevibacter sp.]
MNTSKNQLLSQWWDHQDVKESRDVVENLDIYVPPLNTQKKIGKLLSLFDQKISLNKRINKKFGFVEILIFIEFGLICKCCRLCF